LFTGDIQQTNQTENASGLLKTTGKTLNKSFEVVYKNPTSFS